MNQLNLSNGTTSVAQVVSVNGLIYTQVGNIILQQPADTREEIITPAMAKYLLENHNNVNRQMNRAKVRKYAAEIKAGTFEGTAASVDINVDGEIENGQHTLSAIVESGISLKCRVKTGVKVGYGRFVDVGKQRSLEDGVVMEIKRRSPNASLTHVKALVADAERLLSGFQPKPPESKMSFSDKVDFTIHHQPNFLPIIKLFYENAHRKLEKTNQGIDFAKFRGPFQYYMTGFEPSVSKNDVLNLAKSWLGLGATKLGKNHPLTKFDRWHAKYTKSCAEVGAHVDTFKIYAMLLTAVELALVGKITGIRMMTCKREEKQFSSTLTGNLPVC